MRRGNEAWYSTIIYFLISPDLETKATDSYSGSLARYSCNQLMELLASPLTQQLPIRDLCPAEVREEASWRWVGRVLKTQWLLGDRFGDNKATLWVGLVYVKASNWWLSVA